MTADGPLAAGAAALRSGQWETAQAAFETSLARSESAEALDGLSSALWWLGDTRRSVALRERAYVAFRRAGDPVQAALAAIMLSIHYKSDLGNRPAAAGWLARAERLAGAVDVAPLRGYTWVTRSFLSADHEQAVDLAQQALELARDVEDADLELLALSQLGRALVELGKIDEGMALLDESMAGTLGGECDDLDLVVYCGCAMLSACDVAADLERAGRWCRAAVAFAATYGCPFLYAECRMLYGGVLTATGDWPRAERELHAALQVADEDHQAVRVDGLVRLAELRLRQGRWEDVEALVAEAGDPLATTVPAASAELARGRPAAAVELCVRGLDERDHDRVECAPVLALLVRAHLACDAVDAARDAANRLAALAAERPSGRTAALACLAEARVRAARHDDQAMRPFEQAVEMFSRLELPLESAHARVELARFVAHEQPTVALTEARAALTAFENLGAGADADACAALLRELGAPGHRARRSGESALTRREEEILRLLGAGLSNPEIAQRLFISRKTAAHHVSHVLAKLGVRNRAEAVAYYSRHGDEAATDSTHM